MKTQPNPVVGRLLVHSFRLFAMPFLCASLQAQSFTITPKAGPGGSLYPSAPVIVSSGASQRFIAVADPGYAILDTRINGVSKGRDPMIEVAAVKANTQVVTTFVKDPLVTAVVGKGGRVIPASVAVPYGGSTTFTIQPAAGFAIAGVKVFGKSVPTAGRVTIPAITKPGTIAVTFKPVAGRVLVDATAGPGGKISPAGAFSVPAGANRSYTVKADKGYRIREVRVNGKSLGAAKSFVVKQIRKPVTILADFSRLPVIEVTQPVGGKILPGGAVAAAVGGTKVFRITPLPGYVIDRLLVDGKALPGAGSHAFKKITSNHKLSATFKLKKSHVRIVVTANPGGTVSPAGETALRPGSNKTFTIKPLPGYRVRKVLYNGRTVKAGASFTARNVRKNSTLRVSFEPLTHTVAVSGPAGGSIVPNGNAKVKHGKTLRVVVTPPKGHKAGLRVDGVFTAQNPSGTPLVFDLAQVVASHTLEVLYAPLGSTFAGSLTIGLVGLGESATVSNKSPGVFTALAEGNIGVKRLLCYSERLGQWTPMAPKDTQWQVSIPLLQGDNPLWFAAIGNDGSLVWYPTTITHYPNLDFTTPLTPSVGTITPGTTTTVRWTIGLLETANASVTLYSEDAAGTRQPAGPMRDDGVLPDEIQGDGIFSANVPVTPTAEGYFYYRAGVAKTGQAAYNSELAVLWATPPYNDTQVTAAVKAAGVAKTAFDGAIASGGTPQQSANKAVAALKADPVIGVAGSTEEGSVWWVSKDGILGCYGLKGGTGQKRGSGMPGTGTLQPSPFAANAIPSNAGSPNFYRPEDWQRLKPAAGDPPLSASLSAAAEENRINSDRGVIHSPNLSGFKTGDDYYKPWPIIKGHTGCGLYGAAEYLDKGADSISIVSGFGDYGYIHISSHGDNFFSGLLPLWSEAWGPDDFLRGSLSLVGLWSGAFLPQNSDGTWAPGSFADDLKSKRVAVAPDGEVFLLPDFFSHHLPALPKSLAVLSACRSGYNSSLAKAFMAKGARGVIAYTDYVKTSYAQNTLEEIVKQMYEDKTLEEAVMAAVAKYGADDADKDPAALVFFGDSDLKFPLSTLKNGGFEDGHLTPWVKDGDGRVITALGETKPTEGSYMGIISTGLGYTTSAGSIEQRMCVPAGGGDLSLDWNFFSEEWLEWVGSSYQDTFEIDVAVVDPATGQQGAYESLFSRTIDSLAGAVSQADVGFDKGGVYKTGWNALDIDLDAYKGKTLFLKFYSTDVGDSIYDSAILLDNIRFSPRANP